MTWVGDPRTTTPEWRRTRKRILQRDHYRCTIDGCWDSANEVDHIIAKADGGTDDDANLRSLCSPHHAAKTAAEGHAALARQRAARRRPEPPHPGLR